MAAKSQQAGGVTLAARYEYNPAGQRIGLRTPSGQAIVYGYRNNRVASIAELHSLLTGAGLAAAQAAEVYAKAFVHVNLDTATPQELRLIPGVGARMAHELEEYRPWRGWALISACFQVQRAGDRRPWHQFEVLVLGRGDVAAVLGDKHAAAHRAAEIGARYVKAVGLGDAVDAAGGVGDHGEGA